MNKPLRLVLVGSGNISATYLAAAGKIPGVVIVGVVARNGSRPKALAADAAVPVARSLAEMRAEFDAVIVATPAGLHHVAATAAAELGKHVLTEKPLDISLAAMDAMIQTCRNRNVKLGVAYQRRMSPDNVAVKKLLDAGQLGRVFAADVTVKFHRDDAYYASAPYRGKWEIDGGGPFMGQASHNVDLYCWFFGMPRRVLSMMDTFTHDIEVEDHGAALLRHDDGMIGSITASTATRPGFPPRMEIHSEKGTIVLTNDVITHWSVQGVDQPRRAGEVKVHNGATSAAVTDTAGHEAILRDFVQAVRADRDPAVTGESARLATELILRIYESAQQ